MPRGSERVGSILRLLALLVGAGLILAVPELAPNPYILSVGVVVASYAVLATAWNFVGGFTGYMSLGHVAYFGLGLKAIREDEDKAQSLGVPTFAYKLVAFVVSATFTALGGGLYALWFGDLDPIFQFSVLTSAYIVLMALLGGVRHLFGPLVGALIVGCALEYFKAEYGSTQLHLVATGLLLGAVVMFMPDGIIPAVSNLYARVLRPGESSIREVSAAELLETEGPR